MEQWIDTALKAGGLTLVLALVAYAWEKRIWPFLVKQVEDGKAERQAITAAFDEALRRRDVLAGEVHRETMQAFETLTHEIRRGNGHNGKRNGRKK